GYIQNLNTGKVVPITGIEGNIANIGWSADGKYIFVSSIVGTKNPNLWKLNSDGTHAEKLIDNFYVMDPSPDGNYLLGVILGGPETGIYEFSLRDKKRIPLLPGTTTFMVRMASDHKAFLYSVTGKNEIMFYRQEWSDGKTIGEPKMALRLPFAFPYQFRGNAYDYSPDLSTIIYAKPAGQADFYLLTGS